MSLVHGFHWHVDWQLHHLICDVKHFLYTVPSPEYVPAYIGNYHLTLGLTLGLLTLAIN